MCDVSDLVMSLQTNSNSNKLSTSSIACELGRRCEEKDEWGKNVGGLNPPTKMLGVLSEKWAESVYSHLVSELDLNCFKCNSNFQSSNQIPNSLQLNSDLFKIKLPKSFTRTLFRSTNSFKSCLT